MALVARLTRQARDGVQLVGAAWPQFLRPLVLELASHRPITEVLPGVHHWTAIHPKIRMPVDSYFIEPARVVLDPMVPREGLEWFDGRATPSQVVLTNRHHLRHSTRPRGGGLSFVPGFLLGDDPSAVRAELRDSLRGLLDLDFDNLLFAHGEPLIGGGRVALREFVAGG